MTLAKPWEYILYIEFEGTTSDPSVQKALDNLKEYTLSIRVLGSFPRYQPPIVPLGALGIGM